MKRPWDEIREAYIQDTKEEVTLESLAKLHNIPQSTIEKRSIRESWVLQKKEYCRKVAENLQKKAAEKHSEKLFKSLEFCEVIENHLKRHFIDAENKPIEGKVSTKQLKEISESLAINIRTRRLLLGEPESIIKNNFSGELELEITDKELEEELKELMEIEKRINARQRKKAEEAKSSQAEKENIP